MSDAIKALPLVKRLRAENNRMRTALQSLRAEHEHQADAWNEDGECDQSAYHRGLAKIARDGLKKATP